MLKTYRNLTASNGLILLEDEYVMLYHDNLRVRGGAELVFSYFLRFLEEKFIKLPYLVLTLTE